MVHRYTIQVAEGHQSNWFALPHRVVLLPMTVVHAPECVGRVYEFPLKHSVCNDSFFQYLHSLQKASVSTKQNQPSVSTTNINQPCSFSAPSLVLFQTFSRNNHLLENSQGGDKLHLIREDFLDSKDQQGWLLQGGPLLVTVTNGVMGPL